PTGGGCRAGRLGPPRRPAAVGGKGGGRLPACRACCRRTSPPRGAAGMSGTGVLAAATRLVARGVAPGPQRPRRLRSSAAIRGLVRETRLVAGQMVAPLFVVSGRGREEPIPSLEGHSRLSPDLVLQKAEALARAGVGGVLLFGVPDGKDETGRAAADPAGPVPAALRGLRGA